MCRQVENISFQEEVATYFQTYWLLDPFIIIDSQFEKYNP